MEITNPRRILAVSLTDSAEELSRVVRDLTGSLPEPTVVSPPPPPAATTETTPLFPQPDTALTQPLADPAPSSTLAGTSHVLSLKTAYYTASVPIWLDLVSSPSEWSASFLSDEAKEVLEVLGGVVVVFPLAGSPSSTLSSTVATKELISHVGRVVREGLGGVEWEGVSLAVGVSSSPGGEMTTSSGEDLDAVLDEWEDCCWESGLEFVHHRYPGSTTTTTTTKNDESGDKMRNEFGEKMGISRVLEALQANEWSGAGRDPDDEDKEGLGVDTFPGRSQGKQGGEDGELDPESLDFGFDRGDFAGLRQAILIGGGDGDDEEDGEEDGEELGDDDVQKLERMMHKLQAVRDMASGMPEEKRKRMAKRAVDEVMKEL